MTLKGLKGSYMNKYDKKHNLVGEESTLEKILKGSLNVLMGVSLTFVVWLAFVMAYGIDQMKY
jgi:hypothetical protein